LIPEAKGTRAPPSGKDPILGRPDVIAWHKTLVKGNLVAARARYVRDQWGDSGLRDVAARLSPEHRALFESEILPFSWQPFPLMAAFDAAIVQGPMGGDMAQMKRFGETIARYDLSTLYKVLFKIGTPSFLIKRVGVIYQTYMRGGGNIICESSTSKSAKMVLTDTNMPYYFCSQGIPGWFTAALELSGGTGVRVEQTTCVHHGAPRCVWQGTWD
jgi:hypothetical protein